MLWTETARRTVLIGFDSAWVDNPRQPGALAGLVLEEGQPALFVTPELADFADALARIEALSRPGDLLLVAIDQPILVPNLSGARPVERVVSSVINRLKGGVQPGFSGGRGASMFGDGAPIWRFLSGLGAVQDPAGARAAMQGRFAMEVFPALALPALIPAIWQRGRAAKYNPANRQFQASDWRLICDGLARRAEAAGLVALSDWARTQAGLARPRKPDQDRVDAGLCLLIAALWRFGPRGDCLLIGDRAQGYIVTPASPETGAVLRAAAARVNVPVDGAWRAQILAPVPVRDREQPAVAETPGSAPIAWRDTRGG